MQGELYINGDDAYTTYGVTLGDRTLTQLMTPPPVKNMITNECRLEDGQRVLNPGIRYDQRSVSLTFYISASDRATYLKRYAALMGVLTAGEVKISTTYQNGVVYHLWYQSCASYGQVRGTFGKFSVKFFEPNPANRG